MTSSPHWLPRATGGVVRGELLRRSFESRLERRAGDDEAEREIACARAIESLERLDRTSPGELEQLRTLPSLATAAALRAFVQLSPDAQAAATSVLSLPDDARELVAGVLSLPSEAAGRLRALLGPPRRTSA